MPSVFDKTHIFYASVPEGFPAGAGKSGLTLDCRSLGVQVLTESDVSELEILHLFMPFWRNPLAFGYNMTAIHPFHRHGSTFDLCSVTPCWHLLGRMRSRSNTLELLKVHGIAQPRRLELPDTSH